MYIGCIEKIQTHLILIPTLILSLSIPDIYQAPDSVGIFEHTFLCDGTESQLSDCAQESGSSSNTHQADAYINCQTGTHITNSYWMIILNL